MNKRLYGAFGDLSPIRLNHYSNAVARHIRNSDRRDMPIIAISGFADEIESKLFNFLITKPFENQTLADVIETLK